MEFEDRESAVVAGVFDSVVLSSIECAVGGFDRIFAGIREVGGLGRAVAAGEVMVIDWVMGNFWFLVGGVVGKQRGEFMFWPSDSLAWVVSVGGEGD